MTSRVLLLIIVLALLPVAIQSQEIPPPPPVFEGSIFVASPHPTLFDELKIDAYERLEGSITVEDKAASVTYAPFLLTSEYEWFSETRLKVGQKDNLTTVGLSLLYNPLSPRTKRNLEHWDTTFRNLDALENEEFVSIREELKAFDAALNADDIRRRPAIGPLQTDIARMKQELDTEPAPTAERRALLEKEIPKKQAELDKLKKEARDERNNELINQIAAVEAALVTATDNEKPALREKLRKLRYRLGFNRLEDDPLEAQLSVAALKARQAELQADFEKRAAESLLAYYEKILSSKRPVVGLSYSGTFFPVLDQDGFTDADADQLNDNEHQLNSRSLALTADFRLSARWQLSALGGYTWKRPSAEAGSVRGESVNYGVTAGWVASILNKDFRTSDEYKESFFIPSVVLGLAAEQLQCSSEDATCVDGIDRQLAITPFVDLKLKKASQFRIGIPWKKTNKIDSTGTDGFELVTVIAFQLGQPK